MSINQQQTELIESVNGDWSPEQAARLLEIGGEGDTGAKPEQGGVPNAAGAAPATTANTESTTASDDAANAAAAAAATQQPEGGKPEGAKPDAGQQPAAAATTAVEDPTNTVILAKDGKHTIGYEKLTEARDEAKAWRQKAEDAQRQLDALNAEATQRAQAGQAPTAKDTQVAAASAAVAKGVDPAIFGDFSDEAIAKGIATLMEAREAEILAKVDAKLAPIQQSNATSSTDAHFAAIYAKHPDLDSLVQSRELDVWIKAQPSFVRDAYAGVIQQGTTQQVIELFDRFKDATRTPAAATTTPLSGDAVKAAVAAAIAKAQEQQAPNSLTDLSGGRPGAGAGPDEAWAQMDGPALVEAMAAASHEQIERFVNRRV